MRVPLLVLPDKVVPAGPAKNSGWKGWRLKIFGADLLSKCDCDNVQGCVGSREITVESAEDAEYRDAVIADCSCSNKNPHRHSRFGLLVDKPIFYPGFVSR